MEQDEAISVRGKVFHCDLCNVKITTEKAVEDHLQGKKHQRLSAIQTFRQKQAECSIFVGGLTKLVSELELTDYFSKFGSIAQVIVDKDKGKFAIVEFSERECAEKASEDERQKMNGKKIVVRPREVKPFTPKTSQHESTSKQAKSSAETELNAVMGKLMEAENVSCQMKALVEETCLNRSDLQLRYLICDLLHEVFVEMFPKCRVFPYGSSVNGFGVKGCDLDLQIDLGRDVEEFKYQFSTLPIAHDVDMETTEQTEKQDEAGAEQVDVSSDLDTGDMSNDMVLEALSGLLKRCVPSCQHVKIIPSSRRPVIKFRHKESGLHCDLSLNNRLALRNTQLLHFYSSLDPRVQPLVFSIRHWARYHHLAGNQGPGPRLTNYALTMLVVNYLQNTEPPVLPTVHHLREMSDSSSHPHISGWDCSFTTDASKIDRIDNTDTDESLMKGFFIFYKKCDITTTVLCPSSGSSIPVAQFLQDLNQKASSDGRRTFKVGPVNIQDPLELTHNVAMNVNDKVAGKLREALRSSDLTCISLRYRKREAVDPKDGGVQRWGLLSLFEGRDSGGKGKVSFAANEPLIVIPLKTTQPLTQESLRSHLDEGEMKRTWCRRVSDFVMQVMREVLALECSTVETEHNGQKEGGRIAESAQSEGSGDNEAADSGMMDDLNEHEEEAEEDEPARKRQRFDTCDDQNDVSMTSSGDTSIDTSIDSASDLKSPQPTASPTVDQEDSEFDRAVLCKTCHTVWIGRRKLRRKLQSEKPWGDAPVDELTRERLITEALIKESASQPESVTEFKMELRHKLAPDSTAVTLTFHSVQNEANMRDFAHFFDMFITKLLNTTKL